MEPIYVTYFDKRYRLFPPQTGVRRGWFAVGGGGRDDRVRCSTWSTDFAKAERFVYYLAKGLAPAQARAARDAELAIDAAGERLTIAATRSEEIRRLTRLLLAELWELDDQRERYQETMSVIRALTRSLD